MPIEFTKKNQSVTYLVFSKENGEMFGYFSIALKPLTVKSENVSNTVKRKLARISEFDEMTQTYTMAAYLIAQLGKNYSNGRNKNIAGSELLKLGWIRFVRCNIWAAAWSSFWRQKMRTGCYHSIRITISASLIQGRPLQV